MSAEQKETHSFEEEGGDTELERVRQGREEEVNCMVKTLGTCSIVSFFLKKKMVKMLGKFEVGSWQEATSKAGRRP